MPFRVKDLMIDITTASAANQLVPVGCYIYHSCWFHCSHQITNICTLTCTHLGSPVTTPTINVGCPTSLVTDTLPVTTIVVDPGGLKQRLLQTLAAAEAAEKVQTEAQQPQTVAEVEMIEKKLAEAAEALRARKAELQKPTK